MPTANKSTAKKTSKSAPSAKKKVTAASTVKATGTKKTTLSPRAQELFERYKGDEHGFEIFCGYYLSAHRKKYGDPKLGPKNKDKGIDIISVKRDSFDAIVEVYYVQVKNMEVVSSNVVDALVGAMTKFTKKYGDEDTKHIALLMTSGRFTADAKKAGKASSFDVQFIDGNILSKEKRFD